MTAAPFSDPPLQTQIPIIFSIKKPHFFFFTALENIQTQTKIDEVELEKVVINSVHENIDNKGAETDGKT